MSRATASATSLHSISLWLLGFTAVIIGALLWAWLSHPGSLPVRHVQIHGELRYLDRAALQQVVTEHLTGNLLTQPLGQLEDQLEQLPWVQKAHLRRSWPNAISMELIEQVPVARWSDGGYLNAHGELFVPARGPDHLVHIQAEPGREVALVQQLVRIQTLLQAENLTLTRLEETLRRSIYLTIDQDLQVVLGRTRPLLRLARLLRYHKTLLTHVPRERMIIDLRYPNGLAVRRQAELPKQTRRNLS